MTMQKFADEYVNLDASLEIQRKMRELDRKRDELEKNVLYSQHAANRIVLRNVESPTYKIILYIIFIK